MTEFPVSSVDGWVVIILGVHEEATEDDILEKVEIFGQVKNIHLNLDRRTGYAKGYALVEFSEKNAADSAVRGLRASLQGENVRASWAFIQSPKKLAK